jgi:GGDEF domain-containing protein
MNPLERYLMQSRQQSANPLLDQLNKARQQPTNPLESVLRPVNQPAVADAGLPPGEVTPPDLMTARGRAEQEAFDISAQELFFNELLADPNTSPQQRERIQRIMASNKTVSIGSLVGSENPLLRGIELTNRVTDRRRSWLNNLGRGMLAGPVNWSLLSSADLVTSVVQGLVPKRYEANLYIPQLRDRIIEAQHAWREMMDPQGVAGLAGTTIGAILGPGAAEKAAQMAGAPVRVSAALNPFLHMNRAGMEAVKRFSPSLAALVHRGTLPGATYGQRLLAELVGSGAVDAVQLWDVMTDDRIPTGPEGDLQRLTTLGITAIVSGGVGAVAAAVNKVGKPPVAPEAPKAPTPEPQPQRAQQAAELVEKAKLQANRVTFERRIAQFAKTTYEATTGLKWKDLPAEEKKALIETVRQRAEQAQAEVQAKTVQPAEPTAPPTASEDSPPAAQAVDPNQLAPTELPARASQGDESVDLTKQTLTALFAAADQGSVLSKNKKRVKITRQQLLDEIERRITDTSNKLKSHGLDPSAGYDEQYKFLEGIEDPKLKEKVWRLREDLRLLDSSKKKVGEAPAGTFSGEADAGTGPKMDQPQGFNPFDFQTIENGKQVNYRFETPKDVNDAFVHLDDLRIKALDAGDEATAKAYQAYLGELLIKSKEVGYDMLEDLEASIKTSLVNPPDSIIRYTSTSGIEYGFRSVDDALAELRWMSTQEKEAMLSGSADDLKKIRTEIDNLTKEIDKYIELDAKDGHAKGIKPFRFRVAGGDEKYFNSPEKIRGYIEFLVKSLKDNANDGKPIEAEQNAKLLDAFVRKAREAGYKEALPSTPSRGADSPPSSASPPSTQQEGNLGFDTEGRPWFKTSSGLRVVFDDVDHLMRQLQQWLKVAGDPQSAPDDANVARSMADLARALLEKVREQSSIEVSDPAGNTHIFLTVKQLRDRIAQIKSFLESTETMGGDNPLSPAPEDIEFTVQFLSSLEQALETRAIKVLDSNGESLYFNNLEDLEKQIKTWKYALSQIKPKTGRDEIAKDLQTLITNGEAVYKRLARPDDTKRATIDELLGSNEYKGLMLTDGTPYDPNDENGLVELIGRYRRLANDNSKSVALRQEAQQNLQTLRTALDRIIDDKATLNNIKVVDFDEFRSMPEDVQRDAFNKMSSELREMRQQRDEARRAAEVDGLTGMGNQNAWLRAAETADKDPSVEVVMFDLMNLKAVNDLLGQTEGNNYIISIAKTLETAGHFFEIPIRMFRIGGDEFAAIVPVGKGSELINKVIELAGYHDVQGYRTGVRGAVGNSRIEAESNLNAVKAGEVHKKARKIKAKSEPIDFFGVKVKKPVGDMNLDELDAVIDKLDVALEKGELSEAEYTKALDLIGKAKILLKSSKPSDIRAEPLPPDPSAPQIVNRPAKATPEPTKTDPALARRYVSGKIKDMSIQELQSAITWLENEIALLPKVEAKERGYTKRLADLLDEVQRRNNPPGPGGMILSSHPRVVGVAAGIAAGLMDPQTEEERNFQLALYTIAAVGIGGPSIIRRLQQAKTEQLPAHVRNIREQVKSVEDSPLETSPRFLTRLMRAYEALGRRDLPITNVTKLIGGRDLPAGRNPSKRAEIFGLWRQMADTWMGIAPGQGVGYWTNDGEFVKLDALTLREIASMVDGDLRTVGDLAAARRELELRSMYPPRTLGISLEDARRMYVETPEKYHMAADELTKLYRALAQASVASGLLSKEVFEKFQADMFYVAIRRLFHGEPGKQSLDISVRGNRRESTGPENLFRNLRGSRRPLQNPVEAAIDLIPRYLKAMELNRLAVEFFDHLQAVDETTRSGIARVLTKAQIPEIEQQQLKIAAIKEELAQIGTTISDSEALAIISALSDESLNVTNDVVRFFRDGKMEAWRVSDPIARAFRSLQPFELEMVMEGAGLLTKPTRIARVGITANPVFIGRQALRDIWQFHMNGTYGVDPTSNIFTKAIQAPFSLAQSGIYSIRGWLEIMFRTGEYRNFVAAGAGGESVASQGLRVVRGDIRKSTDLLTKIKEPAARNQFEQIIKELRTGSLREAYASIMQPVADAGRFGAYLKERGRGLDVIEAVWRAKKAGANFNNRGQSLVIRALDRITLFLNPSIQGLDASRYAFMKDPTGYIVRGVAGIMIPSILLWMAYKDDEEINQLRSTPSGRRFWFIRIGGEIVKFAKPIFEGQVFGTTAEAYLDHAYRQDPLAIEQTIESIFEDAGVNLLPFVGVVPVSIYTNKIMGIGSPVVPQFAEKLDPEYRFGPDASKFSRLLSRTTTPALRRYSGPGSQFLSNAFSPAGIDFMISQYLGGSGTEVVRLFETSLQYAHTGMVPAKQEWPFVRQHFPRYPSTGTQALHEFYTMAERYEQAVQTVNYLAETNPSKLDTYIKERQNDIMLGQMYMESRAVVGDFARAMRDVQLASPEIISAEDKKQLVKEFGEQMIEVAKQINSVARDLRDQATQEPSPQPQ